MEDVWPPSGSFYFLGLGSIVVGGEYGSTKCDSIIYPADIDFFKVPSSEATQHQLTRTTNFSHMIKVNKTCTFHQSTFKPRLSK